MGADKLLHALQQIQGIVAEALANSGSSSRRKAKPPVRAAASLSSANALPDHIVRLRDTGFFKSPKTAGETHAKLQPRYACDLNRVAMALLRLQRRKLLRRASKVIGKKKQVAYGW